LFKVSARFITVANKWRNWRVGGGRGFCYFAGMQPGENVFLIGPRASGKTSVARIVAGRLGLEHVDTDEIVVSNLGSSIAEYVGKHGWDAFRQVETKALAQTARAGGRVVATGGGIVLSPENRALLKAGGPVFYLRADPEILAQRLAADPKEAQRPALTNGDLIGEVAQVLAEREPLYRQCADHMVESAGGPEATAGDIIRLIEQEGK
jgi:shikimate kinase